MKNKKGFTLIELLVVVLIIGILAAENLLMVPITPKQLSTILSARMNMVAI